MGGNCIIAERAALIVENKDVKSTLCGFLGIKTTERACRRISGVSPKALARLLLLSVKLLKG